MRRIGYIGIISLLLPIGLAFATNIRQTPVVNVVQENAPAVVNISTERIIFLQETPIWGDYGDEFDTLFERFFYNYSPIYKLKLKSVGSGVILDKNGIIVTNAHVVNMASNIFVILSDGTSIEGKVMYEDIATDLAIIKVSGERQLKPIRLGSTDDLMIGETAIAIGNPLGLENSVTVGVISGKNRRFYSSSGELICKDLLQTDTPINPGNSGGALLNLEGELIGINMAVVQNSQSIGFAIPVEKVKALIQAYKHNKRLSIRHKRKSLSSKKRNKQAKKRLITSKQWDPFEEMERMQQEINQIFQRSFSRYSGKHKLGIFNSRLFYDSNFDMEEADTEYIIRLDVRDLDKNKIDIEITEHAITVSGQRTEEQQTTNQRGFYRSHSFGAFSKIISIPEDVDTEGVRTEIEGDTLIIRLPKRH